LRAAWVDQAQGVIVSGVRPGSPAAEAGLSRGDVILEVNRHAVKSAAELQKMIDKAKAGANLLFLVRRSGNNLFLAMNVPEKNGEGGSQPREPSQWIGVSRWIFSREELANVRSQRSRPSPARVILNTLRKLERLADRDEMEHKSGLHHRSRCSLSASRHPKSTGRAYGFFCSGFFPDD
jgi:membrane-associated protease RseP (regulator of RpoE activity)